MSRASICINNAPIKRFFDYFKTESDDIKKQDIFEEVVTSWNEEQGPCLIFYYFIVHLTGSSS